MNIVLVGMNFRTAPVELRERIAARDLSPSDILNELRNRSSVSECLLLSTCNRVETLAVTPEPNRAVRELVEFLAEGQDTSPDLLSKYLYVLMGREAVRHLFRVSSSLDSMVLGEPQILGQVRQAYRLSVETRSAGAILNRLMHRALFVAKRVRSETGIGSSAVSISYAAVELAKKIFGDLTDKGVLLIGAGEMAELAVRHLARNGARKLFVANRTFDRAVELAREFGGEAVLMEELLDRLQEVEIVISSTGSPSYVLTRKSLQGLMKKRKNRPLFFIDIAVPRDIDPQINDMSNMYVYDIDDLREVVEANLRERQEEARRGERIVEEEALKFEKWLATLDAVPTIKELVEWAEAIRKKEVERTMPRLASLSPEERRIVEAMSISLVKKLLHNPLSFLKRERHHKENLQLDVALTRTLFNLNGNEEDPAPSLTSEKAQC